MNYSQRYAQHPPDPVTPGVSSAISTTEAALLHALQEQRAHGPDEHDSSEPDAPETPEQGRHKKRRHKYTREQKLAAIHYATTATKPGPDGTPQPLEGLEAAKHLNITWGMLKDWVANKAKIENMRPGSIKYRKGQSAVAIQKVMRRPGKPEWDPSKGPRPLAPRDPSAPTASRTVSAPQEPTQEPSPDTDLSPPNTALVRQNPVYLPPVAVETPVNRPAAPRRLPARQTRIEFSSLDEQSSSVNSDLRFSTLQCSQVQTSTVHNCQLAATHVQGGSYVVQSTVRCCYISDESEVRASCMVNSLIRGAKLTNCTVTNSRVIGGEHIGKTFVNATISMSGEEDASRLTLDEERPEMAR